MFRTLIEELHASASRSSFAFWRIDADDASTFDGGSLTNDRLPINGEDCRAKRYFGNGTARQSVTTNP
jgi:hypothetical protein